MANCKWQIAKCLPPLFFSQFALLNLSFDPEALDGHSAFCIENRLIWSPSYMELWCGVKEQEAPGGAPGPHSSAGQRAIWAGRPCRPWFRGTNRCCPLGGLCRHGWSLRTPQAAVQGCGTGGSCLRSRRAFRRSPAFFQDLWPAVLTGRSPSCGHLTLPLANPPGTSWKGSPLFPALPPLVASGPPAARRQSTPMQKSKCKVQNAKSVTNNPNSSPPFHGNN